MLLQVFHLSRQLLINQIYVATYKNHGLYVRISATWRAAGDTCQGRIQNHLDYSKENFRT